MTNLVICGLPGVGKTVIGKALAKKLRWMFVDSDHKLEQTKGMTCRELFRHQGEKSFRELEYQTLQQLENTTTTVLSIGGGTLMYPPNVELLTTFGQLIYLTNDHRILFARITRKVLPTYLDPSQPWESFQKLAVHREKHFNTLSTIKFHTKNYTPQKAATQLIEILSTKV